MSPPADFNYNTDGYEGDGAEDRKSQDGSETMPFIDESPTMSPQLCVRPDGEAVSPTPPEGLLPGVSVFMCLYLMLMLMTLTEPQRRRRHETDINKQNTKQKQDVISCRVGG